MARRTFDVIDVTEILMHWHAGRSKNEMARAWESTARRCGSTSRRRRRRASSRAGLRRASRSGRSWCGAGSRSWLIPGCGR